MDEKTTLLELIFFHVVAIYVAYSGLELFMNY